MKKRLSKLLPAAIKAIDAEFGKQPVIAREYQGYISSFGASVMQMGLLPTLAVFAGEKPDGGSAEDQGKLLNVLHAVVCADASSLSQGVKEILEDPKYSSTKQVKGSERMTTQKDLFRAAIALAKKDSQLRELRSGLLDAAIATKLAIRTFNLSDNG